MLIRSGEDQDRPLCRQASAGSRTALSIRLPGLHVQAPERGRSGRGLHDLQPGGQRQGIDQDAPDGAELVVESKRQPEPGAIMGRDRAEGQRLGDVLRSVPAIHAVQGAASSGRASRPMGPAKVQASQAALPSCLGVVEEAAIPRASTVPALVVGDQNDWLMGAV